MKMTTKSTICILVTSSVFVLVAVVIVLTVLL